MFYVLESPSFPPKVAKPRPHSRVPAKCGFHTESLSPFSLHMMLI